MAWQVDDTIQRNAFALGKHVEVPASSMSKYYEWRRLVNQGTHPKAAAEQVGDMHYEKLKASDFYTIRLSQEHRAVFTLDGQTVKVKQVGGHYP